MRHQIELWNNYVLRGPIIDNFRLKLIDKLKLIKNVDVPDIITNIKRMERTELKNRCKSFKFVGI